MIVIDRIKDFLEDIKNEIEWVLSGMPKPVPIPVEEESDKQ